MRNLGLRRKLKSLCIVSIGGIGAYGAISFFKNDELFYKNVVMPILHQLDPEKTHKLGVLVHKYRLIPKSNFTDPTSLKVTLFGKVFKNPLGIAAGFDKDGEAIMGLQDLGFGHIEIGSVTPEAQGGNEKPRVFRLSEDLAVINRYGFNSEGHDKVLERLQKIRASPDAPNAMIGVNLGKNKTSLDPLHDYVTGIQKFGPVADYLVVNVSSPNTPGLRNLQHKNTLRGLLKAVISTRDHLPQAQKPPILLKLAPDLSSSERRDIAEVVREAQTRVDGLIISNTTVNRPQYLRNGSREETGGLSGRPLKDASTEMVAEMYKLTKGEIPIVGVGGIFSGRDAYEKIKAGASMVQIYTSLVFEGPPVVAKIKKELGELLAQDGYKNVSEAVGSSVK